MIACLLLLCEGQVYMCVYRVDTPFFTVYSVDTVDNEISRGGRCRQRVPPSWRRTAGARTHGTSHLVRDVVAAADARVLSARPRVARMVLALQDILLRPRTHFEASWLPLRLLGPRARQPDVQAAPGCTLTSAAGAHFAVPRASLELQAHRGRAQLLLRLKIGKSARAHASWQPAPRGR